MFPNFGAPANPSGVGGAAVAAPSSGDPVQQFYLEVFVAITGHPNGVFPPSQVAGFLGTSRLEKVVLRSIYNSASEGVAGGLTLQRFINAMKLIAIAQRMIDSNPSAANNLHMSLAHINQHPKFGTTLALVDYPPRLKAKAKQVAAMAQQSAAAASGGTAEAAPSTEPALFADLTGVFGAKLNPNATVSGSPAIQPVAAPTGPAWDRRFGDETVEDPSSKSMGNLQPQTGVPPGGGGSAPPPLMDGFGGFGATHSDPTASNPYAPPVSQPSNVNVFAPPLSGSPQPGVVAAGGSPQQTEPLHYGPSDYLKKQPSRTLVADETAPGFSRRASRNLYEQERYHEQVRTAELREKMARQQANEQRISNEKLGRENESLRREIAEARASQSMALKQSQEALASIQPLRTENEKLKEAITQWKNLIQTKDEELDELTTEVETLRGANLRLENLEHTNSDKSSQLEFALKSTRAELIEKDEKIQSLENVITRHETEKMEWDSEKVNIDLKVAKLEGEVKLLKRKAPNKNPKQMEADLFSGFANDFGGAPDKPKPSPAERKPSPAPPKQPSPIVEPIVSNDAAGDKSAFDAFSFDDFGPAVTTTTMTTSSSSSSAAITAAPPVNTKKKSSPQPPLSDDFGFGGDGFGMDVVPSPMSNSNDLNTAAPIIAEVEPPPAEYEEKEIEVEEVLEVAFEEQFTGDEWFMGKTDLEQYLKGFDQVVGVLEKKRQKENKDDGTPITVVDGNTANIFFKSRKNHVITDPAVLFQIWKAVGANEKGGLDRHMFCCMYHIAAKVKSNPALGKAIPKSKADLPLCIQMESIARIGTTIKRTVKTKKSVKKIKPRPAKKATPQPQPKKSKKDKKANTDMASSSIADDDFANFGSDPKPKPKPKPSPNPQSKPKPKPAPATAAVVASDNKQSQPPPLPPDDFGFGDEDFAVDWDDGATGGGNDDFNTPGETNANGGEDDFENFGNFDF